jgi:hypothetical protein
MNQKGQRKWVVHRIYEPNRLSPAVLVQAYSRVVPYHVRVIRVPAEKLQEPLEEPQKNKKRCAK